MTNSAVGQSALANVRKLREQNAELTRRLEAGMFHRDFFLGWVDRSKEGVAW